MSPIELLVLGHITRDHIGGEQRLGGAAAYASRVAACLGVQTGLVTHAPLDSNLLSPLEALPQLDLETLACDLPTTFELVYGPTGRRIKLLERAPELAFKDIPERFLGAQAAYFAPVIGECPLELVSALPSPIKVAGLQGWLRRAEPDGQIVPITQFDINTIPTSLTAAVFSEEDHPHADELARALSERIQYVVLTRGAEGLTLYEQSSTTHRRALRVEASDPTGAGDTLAAVLTTSLVHGLTLDAALERAVIAAALVVQGPELGKLESHGRALFDPQRLAG